MMETKIRPDNCLPLGIARVLVKDYGPGLSDEELNNLFGEGVQFNPNRLQAGQGSGLGLWISKGIVERHGGLISATSAGHDMGSLFSVELPLYRYIGLKDESISPVVHDDVTGLRTEASFADNGRHLLKTILVVDDDAISRKIVCRLLRKKGFTCTEAVDGLDCLDKMQTGTYDLVLLDYEMPKMNGPDVVDMLRKGGNQCVVFGLTGNCLPEDIEYFTSKGANKVLAKPLQIESLNTLINQYFCTNDAESINNSYSFES
jgi:CheY-like chemotaxis protein